MRRDADAGPPSAYDSGMTPTLPLDPAALRETKAALRMERDAIHLYDGLARMEKDPHRAEAFQTIAADERRHAGVWEARLARRRGVDPAARRPGTPDALHPPGRAPPRHAGRR